MIRRHPMSTDHLFMPISRIEHFKRCHDYMQILRSILIATGSGKAEIATLDHTAKELADVIAMGEIFPPDTPKRRRAPKQPETPLVPEGGEWMHDWIAELAS